MAKWNEKEVEFAEPLFQNGEDAQSISAQFGTLFGYGKSPDAIYRKAQRMGYSITFAPVNMVPLVTTKASRVALPPVSYASLPPGVGELHTVDLKKLRRKAGLSDNEVLKQVVLTDTHVPYHSIPVHYAVMKFCDWYRPHIITIIGDWLDMEAASSFRPLDSAPKLIIPEIEQGISLLDEHLLAAGSQVIRIDYLEGNHEIRLNQYMNDNIPHFMYGLERLGVDLSIPGLMGLKKRGIRYHKYNDILGVGAAGFTHGCYHNKWHVGQHIEKFDMNIYYGHLHSVQTNCFVTPRSLKEGACMGCMCTLKPLYLKNKPGGYVNAFGVFEYRSDSMYTRYNPILIDGKFSYSGIVFDGSQ